MSERPRTGWIFPPERRHLLKEEERRRQVPPEPLLEAAGISPGETVLDVGAGTGFWTLPLARMVGPSGRVIAADIEPLMVEEIRELVQRESLTNVDIARSEELDIPIPDGSADAAVGGFVLHEPADTAAFVREIRRVLQPAGRFLVVEWEKRETERGPPVEHRLSPAEATALLTDAGFTVEALPSPHPDAYALLARGEG